MKTPSENIIPIDFINAVEIPVTIWDSEKQIEVYNNKAFQDAFIKPLTWQKLNNPFIKEGGATFEIKKKKEGTHYVFSLVPKESIEEFISLAAHDLKEPLRKISSFGERLTKAIKEKSDKSELFADRMIDASQRMTTMLDDLLTYSRIHKTEKATTIDLQKEVLAIANEYSLLVSSRFNSTNNNYSLEKEAFLNVVKELISNADKFSPEEKGLNIVANQTDAYLVISFEDKGIGFHNEQSTEIIKPFVRLNGRSAYPGNGMGLAIANKICSLYDGSLSFDSNETGVKAIITWPLS